MIGWKLHTSNRKQRDGPKNKGRGTGKTSSRRQSGVLGVALGTALFSSCLPLFSLHSPSPKPPLLLPLPLIPSILSSRCRLHSFSCTPCDPFFSFFATILPPFDSAILSQVSTSPRLFETLHFIPATCFIPDLIRDTLWNFRRSLPLFPTETPDAILSTITNFDSTSTLHSTRLDNPIRHPNSTYTTRQHVEYRPPHRGSRFQQ